jgi:glycosyltransferase involved in cell wall biosynthesis
MPIEWAEPFGLVMVEALACGTPVIAFNRGSAPEIVDDGETGFLVQDVAGMALAIGQLDQIDPAACRASVSERFGLERVVDAYEAAYTSAREADATQAPLGVSSTISTSVTSSAPAR